MHDIRDENLLETHALHVAHGATAVFTANADHASGTCTVTNGKAGGHTELQFVATNALQGMDTTFIVIQGGPAVAPVVAQDRVARPVVALSQGYPNPAAGEVAFGLDLPEDSPVDWGVYDMQGRRVWSESRAASAGRIELRWSGRGLDGRAAATGLYFIRVRAGESEFVRRVVRL